MYNPSDRYWEILTYLEMDKAIKKHKQKIKELEDENKELKKELENVRQSIQARGEN